MKQDVYKKFEVYEKIYVKAYFLMRGWHSGANAGIKIFKREVLQ